MKKFNNRKRKWDMKRNTIESFKNSRASKFRKQKEKDKKISTAKSFKENLAEVSGKIIGSFLLILWLLFVIFLTDIFLIFSEAYFRGSFTKFTFQYSIFNLYYNTLVFPWHFIHCSNMAYPIRFLLLDQYKRIYRTNSKSLYNVIGCFAFISDDFIKLSNYKFKIKFLYNIYKKSYIEELQKAIKEYYIRTSLDENFIEIDSHVGRDAPLYSIPNRIVLYPDLAYSYYIYANIKSLKNTKKNLKELKQILYTYDIVFEYEKKNNTINYKYININEMNKNTFSRISHNQHLLNYYYPRFVYLYTTKIIEMEKDLYPETFCSDTKVIEKYISVKRKFSDENKNSIDLILKECK